MSNGAHRLRVKNEATGIRVVAQIAQEFWECGWQPFDARNDQGIDGLILMKKKAEDLGVKINVQVKCGAGYISSETDEELRLSIDDSKSLITHIKYWRTQTAPAILVFVNPSKKARDVHGNILKDNNGKTIWLESRLKAQAWWADLKDLELQPEGTVSIIRILKKNKFGEHSKGDFFNLIRPLLGIKNLMRINPTQISKRLYNSTQVGQDSRAFFNEWKSNGPVRCAALNRDIILSRIGWRHIRSKKRGFIRRGNSMKLIGIAKQIIETVTMSYQLTQDDKPGYLFQKHGLRAIIEGNNFPEIVVQVIIARKKDYKTGSDKYWFYSVHYRR